MSKKPADQLLNISQAAKRLGVSAVTLRRWEKQGKLTPQRTAGNQRRYSLSQIKNFKVKGFGTSAEISSSEPSQVSPADFNPPNLVPFTPLTKLQKAVLSLVVTLLITTVTAAAAHQSGLSSKLFPVLTPSPTSPVPQTPSTSGTVLAAQTSVPNDLTFRVNIPARFTDTVTVEELITDNVKINSKVLAPNVIYSLTAGDGIDISLGQTPTISNTGILSLTAGSGITVSGSTITNAGILELTAGDNISIDGNKITNTYSVDLTESGWSTGTNKVILTTIGDNVGLGIAAPTSKLHVVGASNLAGAVTLGSATTDSITFTGRMANGTSLLPDTDLGSDLGSTDLRFNNLWVANINSNSSQSFSGQTTFSYAPTDTTIDEASVLINPTTSAANGQLIGFAIAGYQKALIDEDGDLTLGYSDATSAPATDNPLQIYGHNATNVAYINTSGSAYLAGNLGLGTTAPTANLHIYQNSPSTNQTLFQIGTSDDTSRFTVDEDGDVDIGGKLFGPGQAWYLGTISNSFNIVNQSYSNPSNIYGVGAAGDRLMVGYQFAHTLTSNFDYDTMTIRRIVDGDSSYSEAGDLLRIEKTITNVTAENGNYISWGTPGVSLGLINKSGNLGIGTTGPSGNLHIKSGSSGASPSGNGDELVIEGSGYAGISILTPNSLAGNIYFADPQSNSIGYIGYDHANNFMRFHTNGTEAVRINSSGNLGIGTTGPAVKLHINGPTGEMVRLSNGGGGGTGYIYLAERAQVGYSGGNYAYLSKDSGGAIRLYANDVVIMPSSGNVGIGSDTTPDYFFDVQGAMNVDGATYLATTSGNVGIGTTAPGSKLEVNGAGAFGDGTASLPSLTFSGDTDSGLYRIASDKIALATGATPRLSIDSTGQVGIGTTGPDFKIDTGSTTDNVRFGKIETGAWPTNTGYAYFGHESLNHGTAGNYALLQDSNGNTYLNAASSRQLIFGINNQYKMQLHDTGGFAIGDAYYVTDPGADNVIIEGNVGIGTTGPSTRLHVVPTSSGDNTVTMGDGTNWGRLVFDGSGGVAGIINRGTSTDGIYFGENADTGNYYLRGVGDLYIGAQSSPYLFGEGSTGNVGIGTTGPANLLDVAKATYGAIASITSTHNPAGGENMVSELRFRSTGNTTGTSDMASIGMVINSSNTINQGDLVFSTKAGASSSTLTEYMRIKNGGNVNINVGNLTVGGGDITLVDGGTIGIGGAKWTFDDTSDDISTTGNVGIGTTAPGSKLEVNGAGAFGDGTASLPSLTFSGDTDSGLYRIASDKIALATGATPRLSIDSTGQVGIGTTGPGYKLDVAGEARFDGSLYALDSTGIGLKDDSGTLGLWVEDGGFVGIGTTNPSALLEVKNSSGNSIIKIDAANNSDANLELSEAGTTKWYIQNDGSDSDKLKIWDDGDVRVTIQQDGNLGIGTTGPSYPLDVVGLIQSSTDIFAYGGNTRLQNGMLSFYGGSNKIRSNSTDNITIDPGLSGQADLYLGEPGDSDNVLIEGNVGIGTTGPGAKLEVNGAVLGRSTLTLDSGAGDIQIQAGATWGAASRQQFIIDANEYGPHYIYSKHSSGGTDADLVLGTFANYTNQLVLDSGGNVGIGTTGPGYQLELSTDSAAKPSTNTWTIASDERVKNVLGDFDKGLAEILQINPIIYEYLEGNALGISDPGQHVGIIAQAIQPIFPEAISEDSQGYLHFNSDALSWASINAIKEQQLTIEELMTAVFEEEPVIASVSVAQEDFDELDAEVASLSAQLNALPDINALETRLDTLFDLIVNQSTLSASLLENPVESSPSATLADLGLEDDLNLDGDLLVSGTTNLNDLGIVGKITAGTLIIDGLEGRIESLGEALELNPTGLSEIKMMAGKVVIDKEGNLSVEGTIKAKELCLDDICITKEQLEELLQTIE